MGKICSYLTNPFDIFDRTDDTFNKTVCLHPFFLLLLMLRMSRLCVIGELWIRPEIVNVLPMSINLLSYCMYYMLRYLFMCMALCILFMLKQTINKWYIHNLMKHIHRFDNNFLEMFFFFLLSSILFNISFSNSDPIITVCLYSEKHLNFVYSEKYYYLEVDI